MIESSSNWNKHILLGVILLVYFAVGIVKWNYIINPFIADGDFFLSRYSKESQANFNQHYSDPIRYFLLTPKWISTLLFGNLFLMMNLCIIHLIYNNKSYIRFTFWLFFWVSLISLFALVIGLFTNTYLYIYPIVSRIKELQQSPFTLILLLGAFKLQANSKEDAMI